MYCCIFLPHAHTNTQMKTYKTNDYKKTQGHTPKHTIKQTENTSNKKKARESTPEDTLG